jgi:hypothetical protein
VTPCFRRPQIFYTGTYTLSIEWAGKPVRGSPFQLVVEESGGADKIVIDRESIKYGSIGQQLQTTIDTRLASRGEYE